MKIRLNFPVLLGFALLMALAVTKAHAQQAGASVPATRGTATYSAGSIYPTTQDTTGTLCARLAVLARLRPSSRICGQRLLAPRRRFRLRRPPRQLSRHGYHFGVPAAGHKQFQAGNA